MLQLYVSDRGWNVLTCPVCSRELLPAYHCESGLLVAYRQEFLAAPGQSGWLVCGDFTCTYQEPVVFAHSRADAVVISLTQTLLMFDEENCPSMPAAVARAMARELERRYAESCLPKLRCAAKYYETFARERLDRVEAWLSEAGGEYRVLFYADGREYEGIVRDSNETAFTVATPDGCQVAIDREAVSHERVLYPAKPRPPGRPELDRLIYLPDHRYIVVEGYHLAYGGVQGPNWYVGSTADPAAAKALQMQAAGRGLFRGLFHRGEIERYYWRHNQVRIQGYWLEELGRTEDRAFLQAETTDPEVAAALGMAPRYAMVFTDFGCRDGDLVAYEGCFPAAAAEETAWHEEVRPLPDDDDK